MISSTMLKGKVGAILIALLVSGCGSTYGKKELSSGPTPPQSLKTACKDNAYSDGVGFSYITQMPDGMTVDFLCKNRIIIDWRLVRSSSAITPRSDYELVTFEEYARTGWGPGIRSSHKTTNYAEPQCIDFVGVKKCTTGHGPYIDELIRGVIQVGYLIYPSGNVVDYYSVTSSDNGLSKTKIGDDAPIFTTDVGNQSLAARKNIRYNLKFPIANSPKMVVTNLNSNQSFECESAFVCDWK